MEKYMNALWIYFGAMNCILFVMMGVDKLKAIKGAWRIPEATLFLFAFLGGALGGTLGMHSFRHKTKHRKFEIGFPVIAVIQCAVMMLLIVKVNS